MPCNSMAGQSQRPEASVINVEVIASIETWKPSCANPRAVERLVSRRSTSGWIGRSSRLRVVQLLGSLSSARLVIIFIGYARGGPAHPVTVETLLGWIVGSSPAMTIRSRRAAARLGGSLRAGFRPGRPLGQG